MDGVGEKARRSIAAKTRSVRGIITNRHVPLSGDPHSFRRKTLFRGELDGPHKPLSPRVLITTHVCVELLTSRRNQQFATHTLLAKKPKHANNELGQ